MQLVIEANTPAEAVGDVIQYLEHIQMHTRNASPKVMREVRRKNAELTLLHSLILDLRGATIEPLAEPQPSAQELAGEYPA